MGELLVDAGLVAPHAQQRGADPEMPGQRRIAHSLPDRLKQGVARKKQRASEAVRFLFVNFVVLIHHHVPVGRVKDMCRFVFKDDMRELVRENCCAGRRRRCC